MNSVSNTAELYEVLQRLNIPILQNSALGAPENATEEEMQELARPISEMIDDLFQKYREAKNAKATKRQRDATSALEFLFDNDVAFTEEQLLKFNDVRGDRMRKIREDAIAKESDQALNEFLAGFRIIDGGEAL